LLAVLRCTARPTETLDQLNGNLMIYSILRRRIAQRQLSADYSWIAAGGRQAHEYSRTRLRAASADESNASHQQRKE